MYVESESVIKNFRFNIDMKGPGLFPSRVIYNQINYIVLLTRIHNLILKLR